MKKEAITFVIFGATGNLSHKKLIPSLYNLIDKQNIKIIGIARKNVKKETLLNKSKKYIDKINKKKWKKLNKNFDYFQLDFYDEKKYLELKNILKNDKNLIYFLGTMPEHFEIITKNLKNSNILKNKKNKIVFEKPFAQDLKSAKKLNNSIKKIFSEKEIYRIDHYLGKEIVENIIDLRFKNLVLEPIWNKNYIKNVQIILEEKIGLEERGGEYYDKYGAIKDVVQNHMMQLTSLIAMDKPKTSNSDDIRNEKTKILKKIFPKKLIKGQYIGYKSEKEVKKNSKTETFAAIELEIDHPKWKDVPFYLITGKKMKNKKTSIHIQFREQNQLDIMVYPDKGFYLKSNKNCKEKTTPIKTEFSHKLMHKINSPKAYENLFIEIINSHQELFVRTDEIEEQWRITDKLEKMKTKLYYYKKGSFPNAAKNILKNGEEWNLNN